MRNSWSMAALCLVMALVISGCVQPQHPPRARRNAVQWAEKECLSRDCFLKELGERLHEEGVDADGNQTIRWYMSVRKTRAQEVGEGVEGDTRNYEYYSQDCWFTATFEANGDLLSTEWDGPGCYGRGN